MVGGRPYTILATAPTAVSGAFVAVTTVRGGDNAPIPLGFAPTSSYVTCNAGGCETIYYGPSTAMTVIAPPAGLYISTTATAVLYGTVSGRVLPTSTAFAVVTGVAREVTGEANGRIEGMGVKAIAVGAVAAGVLGLGMI
jgi:hypothetical protein